jgi:hypothetical protein
MGLEAFELQAQYNGLRSEGFPIQMSESLEDLGPNIIQALKKYRDLALEAELVVKKVNDTHLGGHRTAQDAFEAVNAIIHERNEIIEETKAVIKERDEARKEIEKLKREIQNTKFSLDMVQKNDKMPVFGAMSPAANTGESEDEGKGKGKGKAKDEELLVFSTKVDLNFTDQTWA